MGYFRKMNMKQLEVLGRYNFRSLKKYTGSRRIYAYFRSGEFTNCRVNLDPELDFFLVRLISRPVEGNNNIKTIEEELKTAFRIKEELTAAGEETEDRKVGSQLK